METRSRPASQMILPWMFAKIFAVVRNLKKPGNRQNKTQPILDLFVKIKDGPRRTIRQAIKCMRLNFNFKLVVTIYNNFGKITNNYLFETGYCYTTERHHTRIPTRETNIHSCNWITLALQSVSTKLDSSWLPHRIRIGALCP